MDLDGLIYVAGHSGMVGSALVRRLQSSGAANLLLRSRAELDLTNQQAVDSFFAEQRPNYVFLCAARVGGIHANSTFPAEFIRENLLIQTNVIHSAWKHGVRKMLFLGSSCIYPRNCAQPIKEDYLMTGALEQTNEAYAVAKIAGIKMVQAYHAQYGFDGVCIMPTNLYGPGDNYHPENSHVVPALIRRFHEAKATKKPKVIVWGSGRPLREFMHVDDLADAMLFIMNHTNTERLLNVGSGDEISISELAQMISRIVGYEGKVRFDSARPDGTPRKLLDRSRLDQMNWRRRIPLEKGLSAAYQSFLNQI